MHAFVNVCNLTQRSKFAVATLLSLAICDTLLYAMGSDADDVMLSFHLAEDDACDNGPTLRQETQHITKQRSLTPVASRKMSSSMPLLLLFTTLHSTDEMIRDRLFVGLRDAMLSEKLQLHAGLTLETALTKARQSEAVHQQQAFLRGKEEVVPVATVKHKAGQSGKSSSKRKRSKTPTVGEKDRSCGRCGKTPSHARQQCPAPDVKCNSCGKIGHYARLCRG